MRQWQKFGNDAIAPPDAQHVLQNGADGASPARLRQDHVIKGVVRWALWAGAASPAYAASLPTSPDIAPIFSTSNGVVW